MNQTMHTFKSDTAVAQMERDWGEAGTSLMYLGSQGGAMERNRAQLPLLGQQICHHIESRGAAAGVPVQFMFSAPYLAHPVFAGGHTGSEWMMTDVRHDPNMNTGIGYATPRENLNELKALLDVGLDFDAVTAVHQLGPLAYPHQPWQERVLPPPPRQARNLARSLSVWSRNLEHVLKVGAYTLAGGLLLATAGVAIGTLATVATAATTVATIDPIIIGQINLNRPGIRPIHGDPMLYFFLTAWNWEFEVEA